MNRWLLLSAIALGACSFPTAEFRLDAARADDALPRPDVGPPPDVLAVDAPVDVIAPPEAATKDAAPDAGPDPDVTVVPDVTDVALPEDIVCTSAQVLCVGACVSTASNPQHCGGCGLECDSTNGVPQCSAGVCAISCNAGFGDCDMRVSTGCETPVNTLTNCGACGRACGGANASAVCSSGACVLTCNPGFANCDDNDANGCETPVNTASNCGTCGRVCNTTNGVASCSGGACTIACGSGFANCDGDVANGCEAPLNTVANCGACGRTCTAGMSCSAGGCSTICTMTMCAGACVDLNTNPANCGLCGRACMVPNATPVCRASACVVGVCSSGFADCDAIGANGCEVSTTTDNNNCGGCRARCAFANASSTCARGVCVLGACLPGFANCDGIASNGCEVDTRTSTSHCGACDTLCRSHIGGGNSCVAGVCTPSCNPGYGNCDGVGTNGCERHFGTNLTCGGCRTPCAAACQAVAGGCAGVNPGTYRSVFFTIPLPPFVDACAAPGHTNLMPSTDDGSMRVALPFAFRYHNLSLAAGALVNVTTNGWVGFDATVQQQYYSLIPDSTAPNNLAAPFFTDLFTGTDGVCVATIGVAPSRRWVVEWRNAVYLSDRTRAVTFELILSEGSPTVSFYYGTMAAPPIGQTINVGVESPGGVTATTFCNASTNCVVASGARLAYGP